MEFNFSEQVLGLMQSGVDGAVMFGIAYLIVGYLKVLTIVVGLVVGLRWLAKWVKEVDS